MASASALACSFLASASAFSASAFLPLASASAFSAFLRSTYVHKYMSADLPAFLLSCLPVPLPPCLPASLPPYLHALSFDVRLFTSRGVTGLLLHTQCICTVAFAQCGIHSSRPDKGSSEYTSTLNISSLPTLSLSHTRLLLPLSKSVAAANCAQYSPFRSLQL